MAILEGKTALVTEAGSGIGRAVALGMADEGASVAVHDPDAKLAEKTAGGIRDRGGKALAISASALTVAGGESLVQAVIEAFGRVDILVNGLSPCSDSGPADNGQAKRDETIERILKAPFICTRAAARAMRVQRYGRIINFTSEAALNGEGGDAHYVAARTGVSGFSRVVARDLGRYGVTCNVVVPLPTSARDDVPSVPPLACFLASDAAWNINGQVLLVHDNTITLVHQPLQWRSIVTPGIWGVEDLMEMAPGLLTGTANPSPPTEELIPIGGR